MASRTSGSARRRQRQSQHKNRTTNAPLRPKESSFPFPHHFGNGSTMQIAQFPPVLLPTKANARQVRQEIHDLKSPLHALVAGSTSLLSDIVRIVIDYVWHHPPQHAKIPLSATKKHGVDSLVMADAVPLSSKPPAYFLHSDEMMPSVSDIGRLGMEYDEACYETSPIFLVVWVHPSQQIYGVIYPAISLKDFVMSFLDAYYPVVLMTTSYLSTSYAPPTCALYRPNSQPSRYTCKFTKMYGMDDFDLFAGGAPPFCHITPQMYPTLDQGWWANKDIGDCDLQGRVITSSLKLPPLPKFV